MSTERKQRPSLVNSRVKHMQGSGMASSRRATVLNLHFFRWSAMLVMLANFHSFTVPKAVLKRHTCEGGGKKKTKKKKKTGELISPIRMR